LAAWLGPRKPMLHRIAVRGTWLSDEDVTELLTLSLPGIDEIAGLLEIIELGERDRFDHVIVDSAPTGHLLRMLSLPGVLQRVAGVFEDMQARHRAVVSALSGAWIPDAADALVREIDSQASWIAALLQDPRRAVVSWVTLPESMSVEETADGVAWLRRHAVRVDTVIVNRVTPAPLRRCSWCDARRRVERQAIAALRLRVARQETAIVQAPAAPHEPRGVARLSRLGRTIQPVARGGRRPAPAGLRTLPAVFGLGAGPAPPVIAPELRLVLFGGKGGVGKTTCAAAAAIDAAVRMPSRRVLLLSVDPAHSIGDVLGQRCSDAPARVRGAPANLTVREMDAGQAFTALRANFEQAVDALFRHTSSAGGSEAVYDRRVIRDLLDLAPPGVDEIAAIIEITDRLSIADSGERGAAEGYDLVVMDTAPTGHALRLLEMPPLLHDWVRAVMKILLDYRRAIRLERLAPVLLRLSQGLGRLRQVMGDPQLARFITVTRLAALPHLETVRLLNRLTAARVDAPLLIVNAAGAGDCPRCRQERASQERDLAALRRAIGRSGRPGVRIVLAPAEMPPPRRPKALRAWRRRWRELEPA
jgi:arsenite/tail-anchored protein-transporting ATPase